mmetsp:Transcript_15682/g.43325  ORF Transcript_15682/g.43325 Transcript_15682/m.43325 type:complete len:202 (-) Transcript_15682:56-661(-)
MEWGAVWNGAMGTLALSEFGWMHSVGQWDVSSSHRQAYILLAGSMAHARSELLMALLHQAWTTPFSLHGTLLTEAKRESAAVTFLVTSVPACGVLGALRFEALCFRLSDMEDEKAAEEDCTGDPPRDRRTLAPPSTFDLEILPTQSPPLAGAALSSGVSSACEDVAPAAAGYPAAARRSVVRRKGIVEGLFMMRAWCCRCY